LVGDHFLYWLVVGERIHLRVKKSLWGVGGPAGKIDGSSSSGKEKRRYTKDKLILLIKRTSSQVTQVLEGRKGRKGKRAPGKVFVVVRGAHSYTVGPEEKGYCKQTKKGREIIIGRGRAKMEITQNNEGILLMRGGKKKSKRIRVGKTRT